MGMQTLRRQAAREMGECGVSDDNKHGLPSCPEWLAEGRSIGCEMLTEDGVYYECAHCGYPRRKPTQETEEAIYRAWSMNE